MAVFYSTIFQSPFGEIALAVDETGHLSAVLFGGDETLPPHLGPDAKIIPDSGRTAEAVAELEAYFSGKLQVFKTPVSPAIGTPFQRKVWMALTRIPFGETWSYARLAEETGSVARAVGSANGANPVSIVIPCHRVIGANGDLVGYAGGLELKRALLLHEGALIA